MSIDPMDYCRRCGTALCGSERLEDLCPACLREQTTTTFEAARARYDTEAELFTAALESEVIGRTRARYPGATALQVRGEYGEDGLTLRPVRVTAGAEVLDDMSGTDLDDDIGGLLDWLGELTGDAYHGDHELDIRPHSGAATAAVGDRDTGPATGYLVRWEIDIDARDALDAARQALAIQRDPASTATCFAVHPVAGSDEGDIEVDLLEDTGR